MILPVVSSMGRGTGQFARDMLSPLTSRVTGGIQSLKDPLGALKAPPIVHSAKNAIQTIAQGTGEHALQILSNSLNDMSRLLTSIQNTLATKLTSIANQGNQLNFIQRRLDSIDESTESTDKRGDREEKERKRKENRSGFGKGDDALRGLEDEFEKLKGRTQKLKITKKKRPGDDDDNEELSEAMATGIGALALGRIAKIGISIGSGLTAIAGGIAAFANPATIAGFLVLAASLPVFALAMASALEIFEIAGTDFGIFGEFLVSLKPVLDMFVEIIDNAIDTIGNVLAGAWDIVVVVLAELFKYIGDMFKDPEVIAAMKWFFDGMKDSFDKGLKFLEKATELLAPVLNTFLVLKTVIVQAVTKVIDGIVMIVDRLFDLYEGAGDGKGGLVGLAEGLKKVGLEFMEGLADNFERFAKIDAGNLMRVGASIAYLGTGIAAYFGLTTGGKLLNGIFEGASRVAGAFFDMLGLGEKKESAPLIEILEEFATLGPNLNDVGKAVYHLGRGIQALGTTDLSKLGKDFGPFVDMMKEPLETIASIKMDDDAAVPKIAEAIQLLGVRVTDTASPISAELSRNVTSINPAPTTNIVNQSVKTENTQSFNVHGAGSATYRQAPIRTD